MVKLIYKYYFITFMSEVKNIKGIDDETWAEFKSISARHGLKAPQMFRLMVEEYKKNARDFWKDILEHKPIFTAKEYADMKKRVQEIRKEYGWRI